MIIFTLIKSDYYFWYMMVYIFFLSLIIIWNDLNNYILEYLFIFTQIHVKLWLVRESYVELLLNSSLREIRANICTRSDHTVTVAKVLIFLVNKWKWNIENTYAATDLILIWGHDFYSLPCELAMCTFYDNEVDITNEILFKQIILRKRK